MRMLIRSMSQTCGANLTSRCVKRFAFSLIVSLTLGLGLTSSTNAWTQTPVVIKFSHVVASETPKGKGAERFKELAERMTKGRVRIELHPNSTLYSDKDEMEALQLGAVQMLAPSLAKFGLLGVREFEVFDLPFMFANKESLYRVTDGVIGKSLFAKLEAKGIVGLAYWDNGFKVMSANRSLIAPADFQGLKMRVQSSKVLDAQMRMLGASPQVMAFSEVYRALETGVVDGTENPPSNVYTQKMHMVQKNLTVSNHGYLGYAVIVNKKFWDGLPTELRNTLNAAMKEATRYSNAIAQKENDDALNLIRQAGTTTVHVLADKEKAEWYRVLLPVRKEMEARIGKDLIAAVEKESAGAVSK
ncbi:MAG: TRAP transporter substrate-binding protein [Pseudomonadota bacterium]